MMTRLGLPILAVTLLMGCQNMMSPGGGAEGGTEFGSLATCQPVRWAPLYDRAANLSSEDQAQVEQLLRRAWDNYSDIEFARCILVLQETEAFIRNAEARG